jgi:hypothetical protein
MSNCRLLRLWAYFLNLPPSQSGAKMSFQVEKRMLKGWVMDALDDEA